jgi:hypothetical protein
VTEADHVRRLNQRFAGLLPRGQPLAGIGVDKGLSPDMPDRQPVCAVDELIVRGPPDLVIGGRGDGSQLGAGDRAADGSVEMRSAPLLGLNGTEVLHIPADAAASVLPEPID